MTLILVESSISVTEEKVLGGGSPLYGRRTGAIDLPPLSVDDVRQFYPGMIWTRRSNLGASSGGTPYYLRALDPSATLEDNIQACILSKHGVLHNEPESLLQAEFGVREPQIYYTILGAITTGNRETSEISNFAGVDSNSLWLPLEVPSITAHLAGYSSHGESERDAQEPVSTERAALPVLVPLRLKPDRKVRSTRRRGLRGAR